VSSKKASNNPGTCPTHGQKSGLCTRTGARNQFTRLFVVTTKTPPHYRMLIIHPAFYISFYILSRDPPVTASIQQTFEPNCPPTMTVIIMASQQVLRLTVGCQPR
jgi:hypothetical protein